MKLKHFVLLLLCTAISLVTVQPAQTEEGHAPPLRLCATTPDLASLAKAIGGEHITLTTFTKGTEDPHHLVPKPSFVKKLSQADLLIFNGLDLEVGWLPVLIKGSRNLNVHAGKPGSFDASNLINVIGFPEGPIDRSYGHVHLCGNPHFLLDPINGLKIARGLTERLAQLRPKDKTYFENRFQKFGKQLTQKLIGKKLAARYSLSEIEKLALLYEHGKLLDYLKEQNEENLLGGWFKHIEPLRHQKIIADHDQWPYFAKRFGLKIEDFIESRPGIEPSTKHLEKLIEKIINKKIVFLLQSSYFNPQFGKFLSKKTDIKVISIAHQVGAIKNIDTYIKMIEHNITKMSKVLNGPHRN